MQKNSGARSDYTVLQLYRVHDRDLEKEIPSLHTAAKKGNLEELKTLIENGDIFQKDICDRTPLHYACEFAEQKIALEMTQVLLDCSRRGNLVMRINVKGYLDTIRGYVDQQDEKGDTGILKKILKYDIIALHIAARIGHADVVKQLTMAGADYNIRNKEGEEQIQLIYKTLPYHMTSLYDKSVICKDMYFNPNDPNLKLSFSFRAICGAAAFNLNKPVLARETESLSNCLELSLKKQRVILMHPVVQVFLHLKWKKIKVLLWLSILYHIVWLTFYTYFNVNLYVVLCPYQYQTMPNSTDTKIHCDAWNQHSRLVAEICILLLMSISIGLKEVYELRHSRNLKMYFKEPENIGQWLVLGIVVLISITIFLADEDEKKINLPNWQYQVAAITTSRIANISVKIGKIPKFGIYMLILAKVVKGFAMFIITFAMILVAFMLAFQILMPEKDEFNDNPWAFIRLLSMMSGEINYDSLFHEQPDDFQLPFPNSTKLLFAVFIAIVTLILCNLLIGLTVSDIQSLQSDAALVSLSIQVQEINLMETFLMSHTVQELFRKFGHHKWLRKFLVTQQHDDPFIRSTEVDINEIPKDLRSRLKRRATENTYGYSDDDSNRKESIQNAGELRRQIDAILEAYCA